MNDNSPVFTWPSLGNETLTVSNQAPRGHVLATLRARDRDVGVNANLTFYLSVSGSGHWGSEDDWARRPTFIVIRETGAVLVAADLGTSSYLLNYRTHQRSRMRHNSINMQPWPRSLASWLMFHRMYL